MTPVGNASDRNVKLTVASSAPALISTMFTYRPGITASSRSFMKAFRGIVDVVSWGVPGCFLVTAAYVERSLKILMKRTV